MVRHTSNSWGSMKGQNGKQCSCSTDNVISIGSLCIKKVLKTLTIDELHFNVLLRAKILFYGLAPRSSMFLLWVQRKIWNQKNRDLKACGNT